MAAFLDGCRFNPTAGGTTDWTYSSTVTGYQSPAAANVVNGRLYKYRAESSDLSQWELGEGAYNTSSGVLVRSTVLYNSSGGTSKINFTTVPQVAIVALKEDLISIEEANTFTATQQAQVRANIGVGGLKNLFRNGTMDVWQRGTTPAGSLGTFFYTADGWMVNFGGAAGTVARVSNGRSGAYTLYALRLTGATSCTDVQLLQRIESYIAVRAAGNPITVQAQITNNTGASITPTLSAAHAGSQDNWTSPTNELSGASLQACPNGATTLVSYTFTPSTSAANGLEIWFDFGNNLSSNAKSVTVAEVDVQVTPGVPTGLNANPPVPELREVGDETRLCQRYYYAMPSAAYGYPSPNSGDYAAYQRYDFKITMRAVPTVSTSYSSLVNVLSVNAQTRTVDFMMDQIISITTTNTTWTFSMTATAEL
jgi:hypothetical protein